MEVLNRERERERDWADGRVVVLRAIYTIEHVRVPIMYYTTHEYNTTEY